MNQSSTLHAVQRDKAQIRGINEMTANASAGQLEAQFHAGASMSNSAAKRARDVLSASNKLKEA